MHFLSPLQRCGGENHTLRRTGRGGWTYTKNKHYFLSAMLQRNLFCYKGSMGEEQNLAIVEVRE